MFAFTGCNVCMSCSEPCSKKLAAVWRGCVWRRVDARCATFHSCWNRVDTGKVSLKSQRARESSRVVAVGRLLRKGLEVTAPTRLRHPGLPMPPIRRGVATPRERVLNRDAARKAPWVGSWLSRRALQLNLIAAIRHACLPNSAYSHMVTWSVPRFVQVCVCATRPL